MTSTTTVVIHFKPGTAPEKCTKHLVEKALPLVSFTEHPFPTAEDEGLRAIYIVQAPSQNVEKLCTTMRGIEDVQTVQVGAERSLA